MYGLNYYFLLLMNMNNFVIIGICLNVIVLPAVKTGPPGNECRQIHH